LDKHEKWHPNGDMPANQAALQYLKSRTKSDNSNEQKCIRKSLIKIEEWQEGSQEEKAAAWYYTMFCQAYGYGVKKGGSICTRRGWITASDLENHLGLKGKAPHYLAIRPSKWVGWAAIDIDEGSRYHFASDNGEGIEPIKDALSEIGLQNCMEFQSSNSGGIHLWYPLATLKRVWDLARELDACFLRKGLEIRNGVLELRPNTKQYNSDYLMIRGPLTGEGNRYWEPEHGAFGLHEELQLFHKLWMEKQNDNKFKPLRERNHQTIITSPNRRRPVKSYYNLEYIQKRLLTGFTGRGQTQELKLYSPMVARLIEGIDNFIDLKERTHELLENLPGFNHYCGHKQEIKKRRFISKGELIKCLKMTPGGYENTWKEKSNVRRAKKSSEDALAVIEKASEEGMTFNSENKAIEYLNGQGGPVKSWWRKKSNKQYLQIMKERLVKKQNFSQDNMAA